MWVFLLATILEDKTRSKKLSDGWAVIQPLDIIEKKYVAKSIKVYIKSAFIKALINMSQPYTFSYSRYRSSSENQEVFRVLNTIHPDPPEDIVERIIEKNGGTTLLEEKRKKMIKIKRRTVQHPSLRKILKKNGNMPKFIIGNFHKYMKGYKNEFQNAQDYQDCQLKISDWLCKRIDLNTAHMEILFGGFSQANYIHCKILRKIINDHGMEMLLGKTKVQNSLSYLVCLQKYTFRLMNSHLIRRIQSR